MANPDSRASKFAYDGTKKMLRQGAEAGGGGRRHLRDPLYPVRFIVFVGRFRFIVFVVRFRFTVFDEDNTPSTAAAGGGWVKCCSIHRHFMTAFLSSSVFILVFIF